MLFYPVTTRNLHQVVRPPSPSLYIHRSTLRATYMRVHYIGDFSFEWISLFLFRSKRNTLSIVLFIILQVT